MVSEDQIFETLKSVIDPEIGINIVDLGLIYMLDIQEDKISIDMTLTTPGCPMHNNITAWVKENLTKLAPGLEVDVNLVWQPRWTPEDMSDDAKKQLGYIK